MATEHEVTALSQRLEELLQGDGVKEAVHLLESIHPADQADIFLRLDPDLREAFLTLFSGDGLAHLLEYLHEDDRRQVIDKMPRASLARVLDRMESDEAADILQGLPPAEAARVLSNMDTGSQIYPLLAHTEESAGGLMTRGYVALHKVMTAQEAITFLRLRQPFAEEAYYLYVLDANNRVEGVVNLRQLIVAAPGTRIEEIMTQDVISVAPGTDQEECARLIQHYRLRALPVVDEERQLRGIITADDLMEVATEEATEDMFRMAGLPADESIYAPLRISARRQIPWLMLNLVTVLFAAGLVAAFEGTIEKVTALVIFMPVVAALGGNSGIQTITLVVRSLALREVELKDAQRVLMREISIGIVKGLTVGVLVGLIAWAWKGNLTLGFIVGVALLGNMLVAGSFGALIPLGLRALRLDPAIASGIVLTTFTDALGFLFLLGLATLMITQLT
ncbi:MAG: magnesium transporter [Dehalococcoidia bacterium]